MSRFDNDRLPSLTGLRFAGALTVFGFHFYGQGLITDADAHQVGDLLFMRAPSWLAFFFILSGFVLMWGTSPDTSARTIWRRRLARIFPSHMVTWLITLAGIGIVGNQVLSPGAALPGLFLLQAWVPNQNVFFAVNTPAWSLSCELAFYAAFPLLMRWIGRIGVRWLWPCAALLVIGTFVVSISAMTLPDNIAHWVVWVFPLTRMLEFVLGMVLARIVRAGLWIGIGLWPAMGLVLVGYAASINLPAPFAFVLATVMPLAILIPSAAASDLGGRSSPWRTKALVWLGDLSFAFYLLHQVIIRVVSHVLGDKDLTVAGSVVTAVVTFLITLVASWILHRGVEVPMMRLLGSSRPVRPHAEGTELPVAEAIATR